MENLFLFNSFSQKKERFISMAALEAQLPMLRRQGEVTLYVCGITPYDVTHLGHAFTYTVFDVLTRYLRQKGYFVRYVQNLTDIDDDILVRAKKVKQNWRRLGEKNAERFLEEMRWLNNNPPDWYIRATDYIPEMIEIIQKLEKEGFAYEKEGSVYFSIDNDKHYGELSKLSRRDMLAIASQRGNNPDDPHKRDPLDFVLWQRKKPGEPAWSSPWGMGRPGWHIECSAMAMKRLGATLDIHGGGGDLLFPHHESSRAQSEGSTGKTFVRYWMHTGMLRYQGEKMSKSLGNLVLIADLQKKYRVNTIRIYLLSHHYRSAFEFFEGDLKKAEEMRKRMMSAWRAPSGQGTRLAVDSFRARFYAAMDDDLNTPLSLTVVAELAEAILKGSAENQRVADAKALLNELYLVLGLVMEFC